MTTANTKPTDKPAIPSTGNDRRSPVSGKRLTLNYKNISMSYIIQSYLT